MEIDESGFRACDENMGESDSMMAKWAGGVITCPRSEMIQVISMKGVSCDKLETRRLEIARASDKAPQ